jgi:hypothetical protein
MKQIQSYTLRIVKQDGRKPAENCSRFSIMVRYQDGTYQSYAPVAHDSRPSVEGRVVQSHLNDCLDILLSCSGALPGDD